MPTSILYNTWTRAATNEQMYRAGQFQRDYLPGQQSGKSSPKAMTIESIRGLEQIPHLHQKIICHISHRCQERLAKSPSSARQFDWMEIDGICKMCAQVAE